MTLIRPVLIAPPAFDASAWVLTSTQAPPEFSGSSVACGDGKFVTAGCGSTYGAYSTDGINWTQMTLPSSQTWQAVTYGNGKFVAVVYGSNYGAICDFSTIPIA